MAKKPKLPHLVKKVLRKRAPVRIAPVPEPPPPAPIELPEPPAPAPLVMPDARDAKAHKRNWVVGAVVASGIFVLAVGYLAYLSAPIPEPIPGPAIEPTASATMTATPGDSPEPTPTDTGSPLATPTVAPTAVPTPSPQPPSPPYTALLICAGGTPSGPDQCTGK